MLNRCRLFFVCVFLFLIYISPALAKEDSSFDLEPIVITKSSVHLINPYNIDSDSFKNLYFSSPIEALGVLPLDLQSRSLKGGIQTDFSLRGSTFQGVLVLINGQRINDPQTAHHNSDIPLTKEDIERIEVIPGAGSSLFGPDATGGAINIILKKPEDKTKVLELGGGQHQTNFSLFSLSDKINDWGVRFSVENRESDGFYEDTDFKKFTSTFRAVKDFSEGEFDLELGYQEKEFGAYDFYTPAKGYLSKEWTKTWLLNTGFNLKKDGFLIKPNFLWRRHFDKFMLDKTLQRSLSLNHHRTDIYTPSIYFQKETDILGKVGLGLEYGGERINSTNLGKHNRNHKGIFMDESKDLAARLSLGSSFRIDKYDGFEHVYAGAINLKYSLSEEHSLHLGVSRSIRVPSFNELYYSDPTTLGDAGLSRERSLNYELGYDYKKENLSLGITSFCREEKDFIDWIKRTQLQAKWQAENITEARVFGIENYARIDINPYFSLNFNYTYIDKRINDRGYLYKYGPNYIRHLSNAILTFNLPFGVQSIGLTYKKKPARDGWVLLNTHLSFNPHKKLEVFLDVTNLLNVEYQEIEGIPQPGRWAEAGLRFRW